MPREAVFERIVDNITLQEYQEQTLGYGTFSEWHSTVFPGKKHCCPDWYKAVENTTKHPTYYRHLVYDVDIKLSSVARRIVGDRGAEVTHDQKLWYNRENRSLHLHCQCRTALPVLGPLRVGDIFTDVKEVIKDGVRGLHIVCTVVADTRENWAPSGFKGLQEMIILQIAHKNAVTGVDLVGKKIQKYISERDQGLPTEKDAPWLFGDFKDALGGGLLLETLAEWHDAFSTLGENDLDVYLEEVGNIASKEGEKAVKLAPKFSDSDFSVSDGTGSSSDGSLSSTPTKQVEQQELGIEFSGVGKSKREKKHALAKTRQQLGKLRQSVKEKAKAMMRKASKPVKFWRTATGTPQTCRSILPAACKTEE